MSLMHFAIDDRFAGGHSHLSGMWPYGYAARFRWVALMVQEVLERDPFSGALFAFRGKRGDLIKLLWWDMQGLCLFSKRLEKGRFVWPMAATGTVSLTGAQLSMLLEGIDWRAPVRSWRPSSAG
jgi:transposase